jgi:hypothetical protein
MREIRTSRLMSGEETGRASDTAPFLDSTIDAVLIVCAIRGERGDGTVDLIKQSADLRAIINIFAGQRRRNDIDDMLRKEPACYAPPPVVYAPPQPHGQAPAPGGQSCCAGAYVCPMDRPVATGSSCYCLGNSGQRVGGRAS